MADLEVQLRQLEKLADTLSPAARECRAAALGVTEARLPLLACGTVKHSERIEELALLFGETTEKFLRWASDEATVLAEKLDQAASAYRQTDEQGAAEYANLKK